MDDCCARQVTVISQCESTHEYRRLLSNQVIGKMRNCGMRKVKCGIQKCGKVCGMVGKTRNAERAVCKVDKLVNLQIALSCSSCAVQWIRDCYRILKKFL